MSIYEAKHYSFELNPEMMAALAEEFDVDKLSSDFAQAVEGKTGDELEAKAESFFTDYGTRWIKKSHKLGEEYPDRTYEVLLEAIDKTGGYMRFALVPQRFLEIAYLATQDFPHLTVIENNQYRLIYRLNDCKTYQKLKEKCGDAVAETLPCRHACTTACEVLHRDLEVDAKVEMQAEMPKDGYCQFAAIRA